MYTINRESYNKWLNLYNEDVESMWYSQHPQLRNAAMLLKALDNEFKIIYGIAEETIKGLKSKCDSEKDKTLNGKDLIHEKENISCNKPDGESPDVFLCTPSPTKLSLSNETDEEMITSQESNYSHNISPKINRFRRLPKFKKLRKNNDSSYSSLEVNQTPNISNKLQILKNVDSTVIETTPQTTMALKCTKSHKNVDKIKKNKIKRQLNNATITQVKRSNEDNSDSDLTYCPNVEEMTISVVNSKENEDKEKLGKELVFKESVVRGKARLHLEGWDCTDCKAFYDQLDLNTQETKKMLNKCSRHRSKFKPQDYTPKEFWNLDFPPTQ